MNNTVENDFFGFPKVKWLHLIGDVGKSVRFHVNFYQDLAYQKLSKSLFFDSYSKNKRWTFLGTQCSYSKYSRCLLLGQILPKSVYDQTT